MLNRPGKILVALLGALLFFGPLTGKTDRVFFVVIYTILAIILWLPIANVAYRGVDYVFDKIAKKYNGRVDFPGNESSGRAVIRMIFNHRGTDVLFYGYSEDQRDVLSVVAFPAASVRYITFLLETEFPTMNRQGSFLISNPESPYLKRKGIGVHFNLDEDFQVYCENTAWLSSILTPSLQQELNEQKDAIAEISLEGNKFKVKYAEKTYELFRDRLSQIEKLINTALRLIDSINTANNE